MDDSISDKDYFLFNHLINITEYAQKDNGIIFKRSKYLYRAEIFLYNMHIKSYTNTFAVNEEDLPLDMINFNYEDKKIKICRVLRMILRMIDKYNKLGKTNIRYDKIEIVRRAK